MTTYLQGASVKERLIEACRRNNTDLLTETLEDKPDDEISKLLNETTTVMGNHLYHEAASQGNCTLLSLHTRSPNTPMRKAMLVIITLYAYTSLENADEIIDHLLDQPDFECDPINRQEGDTPLHTAIRWLNGEPPAQRPFGLHLIEMMLEAGSNPRVKNKGGLTAYHLVDPRNQELRDLIQKHEYANQNAGDFINVGQQTKAGGGGGAVLDAESDDDAEFSGSDDEERAEWERRRKEKGRR